MDRFQALHVFVKVAEHGSFAATARELAMSPPAVTRAISALEERIGTRLLVRTTRSVRLTESGERFVQDCRRILLELEEAEEAAIGSHGAPRGELRITSSAMFGRMYVTPIIADFLDKYPLVTCQTQFVDRNVNMMDEGLDVAIRIGNLADSSLIATRAGTVRWVMFAAPAYLEKHGVPKHPKDLQNHRLIQYTALGGGPEWPYQENRTRRSVRIKPRVRMNTIDATVEIAASGWGISRLLSYQIAPYLADGRLKTVLSKFGLPPVPIHVVHQEGRMVSTKVRAFVDFAVERLRANPAIN